MLFALECSLNKIFLDILFLKISFTENYFFEMNE